MLTLFFLLVIANSFGGHWGGSFGAGGKGGSFGGGGSKTLSFKYGKYYKGNQDYSDNTYWCFVPQKYESGKKYPVVIDIHGGGFTGGSALHSAGDGAGPGSWKASQYVSQGMIVCSFGYRLVTTKYYYEKSGSKHVEEYVKVDAEGRLSIDPSKIVTDYKVKVGRTEFMTKCIYDAVQAFEHLLTKSNIPIDPHNIGFYSFSAGTAEAVYLTWTYWKWNQDRYTVKSFMGTWNQLDYPVENAVNPVFDPFVKDLGRNAKLSQVMSSKACGDILGNPWCSKSSQVPVCNEGWHKQRMEKFCGSSFRSATLNDLINDPTSQWPMNTDQDKGIARLWCTSCQIKDAPRNPDLKVYINNPLRGTDTMSVVHNPKYAMAYGDLGDAHGYKYVVMGAGRTRSNDNFKNGQYGSSSFMLEWTKRAFGMGKYGNQNSQFVSFIQVAETPEATHNTTESMGHNKHKKKTHSKKARKTDIGARRLFF